jgi:hypothetical protein
MNSRVSPSAFPHERLLQEGERGKGKEMIFDSYTTYLNSSIQN